MKKDQRKYVLILLLLMLAVLPGGCGKELVSEVLS